MCPILYHSVLLPSSRAVLLLIRNLDLDQYEVKNIDLHMDELNPPECLLIDERHQVPVYVDGDFALSESRAILCYLANLMGKFYPKDLKRRALVDSRLCFDGTNSFAILRDFWVIFFSISMIWLKLSQIFRKLPAFRGKRKLLPNRCEGVKILLEKMESFLLNSDWFAGDDITIADFSFLASVATIKVWAVCIIARRFLIPILCFPSQAFGANLKDYPKLYQWHERCRSLPGFLENQKGAKFLAKEISLLVNEILWPSDQ